jgi:hypothetical protein
LADIRHRQRQQQSQHQQQKSHHIFPDRVASGIVGDKLFTLKRTVSRVGSIQSMHYNHIQDGSGNAFVKPVKGREVCVPENYLIFIKHREILIRG